MSKLISGRLGGLLLVLTGIAMVLAACTSLAGGPTVLQSNAVQPTSGSLPAADATVTSQPAAIKPTVTVTPDTRPSVPIPDTISGTVVDANGPVADAIIQVKGTPNRITTSKDGKFTLQGLGGTKLLTVTAWANGYFVGWTDLNPKEPIWMNGKDISITLKPLYAVDNAKYEWFSWEGKKGSESCAICHREYPEWQADAHSQSAKNIRFETIYKGTNVKGQVSQESKMGHNGALLPPDPALPYYGPGYKLDNPQRSGNCATCHTPVASKVPNRVNCGWSGCHKDITVENSKGVIDPNTTPVSLSGLAAEGISCEFCHKVGEVILDPKTNLPLPDMPGILSMRLYRPPDGQQVFFGTLVDVNRRVSYSPLQTKSEYCAPCHYGVFGGVMGSGTVSGGTVIYNSYGEWLDSPYSDPKTGKTCQDCHMPVKDTQISVFTEKGGIPRDYALFHEHKMPGVTDEKFMKDAVSLKNKSERAAGKLKVEVSVTNDNTGHHVPTDAPIRSMMLVVEALDASGKLLTLTEGSVLPKWAGNYAGQAGKGFAKILKDDWTGETPTAAYWRPVTIVEDTRLAAMATDTTHYTFDLADGNTATIKIKLIFRRAFQVLAQQKGWTDPDLIMAEQTIQLEK
jgi:hypothetical protein